MGLGPVGLRWLTAPEAERGESLVLDVSVI